MSLDFGGPTPGIESDEDPDLPPEVGTAHRIDDYWEVSDLPSGIVEHLDELNEIAGDNYWFAIEHGDNGEVWVLRFECIDLDVRRNTEFNLDLPRGEQS